MTYRVTDNISCAQAAYDVLEKLQKKGAGQLSFGVVRENILDENLVDLYYKNENDAMVFIAENLDEAKKTMSDYRMYTRYSARLDPLRDPVSFADAMIERKALEIARNGSPMKPQIHINHVMNDERSFDEVVAAASGRMKSDLADGCSFETVSLESYSYGMDAAHLSEQQAAFFMMKNADCYLKEYDFELTERSDFLSDVMGWEARIIGEKAVEEVLTELEQAGIDIRNDLAVSEFYDYRRPALDNVIEAASNRIGSPDNTLEKEIEEARGC